MSQPTHPALEALRQLADGRLDSPRYRDDHETAAAAIPALEELLAERDRLHALKCDIGIALGGDDERPFPTRVVELKAERDKALALVADFERLHHGDGPGFHEGTDLGRLLNRAAKMRRAALAKGES